MQSLKTFPFYFSHLVFIHQNTKETMNNLTTYYIQSLVRNPHTDVLRGMTVGLATEL